MQELSLKESEHILSSKKTSVGFTYFTSNLFGFLCELVYDLIMSLPKW